MTLKEIEERFEGNTQYDPEDPVPDHAFKAAQRRGSAGGGSGNGGHSGNFEPMSMESGAGSGEGYGGGDGATKLPWKTVSGTSSGGRGKKGAAGGIEAALAGGRR